MRRVGNVLLALLWLQIATANVAVWVLHCQVLELDRPAIHMNHRMASDRDSESSPDDCGRSISGGNCGVLGLVLVDAVAPVVPSVPMSATAPLEQPSRPLSGIPFPPIPLDPPPPRA